MKKGIVVMFANQKGGVGKSTTTQETAMHLASKKYKVLMIDGDAQCNLSQNFGLDQMSSEVKIHSIVDACTGETEVKDCIYNVAKNVDLIPGSRKMLAENFIPDPEEGQPYNKYLYYNLLKEMIEVIRENQKDEEGFLLYPDYDFILIDSAPQAGLIQMIELCASDYVVGLTDVGKEGYKGLVQLYSEIMKGYTENNGKRQYPDFNCKMLGMAMTMVDDRTSMKDVQDERLRELGNDISSTFFKSYIRNSTRVKQSKELEQSMFEYDRKSKISNDYRSFTNEMLSLIEKSEKAV